MTRLFCWIFGVYLLSQSSLQAQRSVPLSHEPLLDDIFRTDKSSIVIGNSFFRFRNYNFALVIFAKSVDNSRYFMCLTFHIEDSQMAADFVAQKGDFVHLYLNKRDTLRLENWYHARAYADTPGFFPDYYGEMWLAISPEQLEHLSTTPVRGVDIFLKSRQSPSPLRINPNLSRRNQRNLYRSLTGWWGGIAHLTPKSRKRINRAAQAILANPLQAAKPASPQLLPTPKRRRS